MPLTKLKIVVFAPMPNASVNTAIKLKPGFFMNIRAPKRKSFRKVLIITFSGSEFRVQSSEFRVQGLNVDKTLNPEL
jgi:hypothetical protein